MKLIILALCLCATAYATTDVKAAIKAIDAHPFGRALLDTVWLQLQTGDPLDKLLSTLSELEDRYHDEQKQDDSDNKDFQDACDVDIAVFDKDIASTDNERIVLEAKLEGELYPKREIVQGIVSMKQKELNGLNHELAELDETREEEAETFEDAVREHTEATAIITETRNLFTDNMVAPSGEEAFVQKRKVHPQARISEEGIALVQKHLMQGAKRAGKDTYTTQLFP